MFRRWGFDRSVLPAIIPSVPRTDRGVVQQTVRLLVRLQQQLNAAAELGIAGTGAIERSLARPASAALKLPGRCLAHARRRLLNENRRRNFQPREKKCDVRRENAQKSQKNSKVLHAPVPSPTELCAEPSFGVNP